MFCSRTGKQIQTLATASTTKPTKPAAEQSLEFLLPPLTSDLVLTNTSLHSLVSAGTVQAKALTQLLQRLTLLTYRVEVVERKKKWVESVVHEDNNVPIKMARRDDLKPHLEELEVSSRDLNTQVKECIADMESAIAAFRTLDSTCRHQIELNKSVASELQQAGVFSSATKKLVLSDVFQEISSRINSSVLISPTPIAEESSSSPSSNNARKSWESLLETWTQTRIRQEQIYSATYKTLAAVAPTTSRTQSAAAAAPPADAISLRNPNEDTCSKNSFHIASPSPVATLVRKQSRSNSGIRAGNDATFVQTADGGDGGDGNESSEEIQLVRKRKRSLIVDDDDADHAGENDISNSHHPLVQAALGPRRKKPAAVAALENIDPPCSAMSVMSRVQMTPLKDMDRYMAGASLIRNDIGIEQVLVQETNSLVGGGEREGALVHHPHTLTELSAIETGQHRRLSAHSCRTSKSSQSSRTTAGEREYFDWEGNLNLKSNVQNNVKDDADDVDDFEEYGQSAFSIVEYEEAGAALSAESETSTGEAGRGSLVAQASMGAYSKTI